MGEFADMLVAETVDSYWDGYGEEPDGYTPHIANGRVCRHCEYFPLFWKRTTVKGKDVFQLVEPDGYVHECIKDLDAVFEGRTNAI